MLKIAEDTYMFKSQKGLSSNIYLIEVERTRILIDSGASFFDKFKPDLCILTHGHFDHTGGVGEDWKVILHPLEFNFRGPYILIPKNASENPMKPIKIGSHVLEFFHTPGHTDGSICIFDKKTKILFSGDTLFADKITGRTDLGGSQKQLEKSLKIIEKIPYTLLCPGHGEIEWR
jgi:glyoxylase-like metal-dependent hydrolase (beta-lactamase superfamily II)